MNEKIWTIPKSFLKIEYTDYNGFILSDYSYFIRYAITLWHEYMTGYNSRYDYQITFEIVSSRPHDNDTSFVKTSENIEYI